MFLINSHNYNSSYMKRKHLKNKMRIAIKINCLKQTFFRQVLSRERKKKHQNYDFGERQSAQMWCSFELLLSIRHFLYS